MPGTDAPPTIMSTKNDQTTTTKNGTVANGPANGAEIGVESNIGPVTTTRESLASSAKPLGTMTGNN